MSECKQCGVNGHEGPPLLAGELDIALSHAIEYLNRGGGNSNAMLFQHSGEYYCYPCHCLVNNACFVCGEVVDYLFNDKRCKNLNYVCENCLKGPVNHKWKCYQNGCMTPEEFAQAEFEMMNEE